MNARQSHCLPPEGQDKASRRSKLPYWKGLVERPGRCPLWVISGHLHCNRPCPLYPHKRTFAVQTPISAMGQKRTSSHLFNHLVGADEQIVRNFKTECLGGLEVDDNLELCRPLYRQVARLLAFENARDINDSSAINDLSPLDADQRA